LQAATVTEKNVAGDRPSRAVSVKEYCNPENA